MGNCNSTKLCTKHRTTYVRVRCHVTRYAYQILTICMQFFCPYLPIHSVILLTITSFKNDILIDYDMAVVLDISPLEILKKILLKSIRVR